MITPYNHCTCMCEPLPGSTNSSTSILPGLLLLNILCFLDMASTYILGYTYHKEVVVFISPRSNEERSSFAPEVKGATQHG